MLGNLRTDVLAALFFALLPGAAPAILRRGRNWNSPTLRFNFVDSAINLYKHFDTLAD
jgi:hypothetical protein